MKKLLFIMNPCAGTRKANRYLPELIGIFNQAGYEVTTYMTAGQGDCARIVSSRGPEADMVVCCGGDGTFNETVSGILSQGLDIPMGYIPAGSTNDLAASLKLPLDVLEAARGIVAGSPVKYDVGQFGDRYFSYVASFGAFTRTSYATPQSVKNMLGHTAYVLSGISELGQLKNEHVRLELADGTVIEDDFIFGAVSNATSVGGVITLDPKQVDMRDGRFEILLVRAPRNLGELAEGIVALQKQTYNCAMMKFFSSESVRVRCRQDLDWTLDGEWARGGGEISIRNLHRGVTLMMREEPK